MHTYQTGVFIGRFQLFHLGHLAVARAALEKSEKLLVLVGSSNVTRSPKNPFTFEERKTMISRSLQAFVDAGRVEIHPLRDFLYSEGVWLAEVQAIVSRLSGDAVSADTVALFGHHKDSSSYYLDEFPQFAKEEVLDTTGISATDLRNQILFREGAQARDLEPYVPPAVVGFMDTFRRLEVFQALVDEQAFVQEYRAQFAHLRYPVIFSTTDAVVTCNGHLLVVERRSQPGKGLLALPGGFLGYDEYILDSAIRELREETRLRVPVPVLRGSLAAKDVFDDPRRSQRGRTITYAFHFDLVSAELPKVRGGDDAAKAFWLSFADFKALDGRMYEDHWHIASKFLRFG